MKLKVLMVFFAAVAASGCVFHHEVKSEPDRDRMELAARAEAPAAHASAETRN